MSTQYSNQEIINQYSIEISQQTANTIRSSLFTVNLLSLQFNLQTVSKIELNSWWKSYSSDKATATKKQRLANIHKVFNFMEEFDIRKDNPSTVLTISKDKKDKSKTYNLPSLEDYNKIFDDCTIDESIKIAIALTIYSGLRNSEVCNLKYEDIDLGNETIYIRDAKSGSAEIPIPSILANMIDKYIKSDKIVSGYLVRNKQLGKMKDDNFRLRYKTVLKKHGLDTSLRVHDNRHFCASQMLNNGASIVVVKDILRHADINTTQRYLHANKEVMKQQINSIW